MKDVREALMVGRNSDGTLVRRPLSPHLQVYRLPLVALTSIANRITGVALCAGLLLMVWWLAAAAAGPGPFAAVQGFIGTWLGLLMLFGWTAALMYHALNGIRHLIWDAGFGYELPTAIATGRLVVAASIGLTLLVWLIGLVAW
jgi:succinate dehydrogenase / fumarate reductase cytochrome b subunit